MTNLWRLQTRTDSFNGEKIDQYCLKNNCLAMGWSLKDEHIKDKSLKLTEKQIDEVIELRKRIHSFDDYINLISEYGIYGGKVNNSLSKLNSDVKEGDLVWLRSGGLYYLGRISNESKWQYSKDENALKLDATNQVNNVEWCYIGDESEVPGSVSTSFIRGRTLQRICKNGILEYSQLIFNEYAHKNIYGHVRVKRNVSTFYSLLSTNDCEDLLCLWLYSEYGYIVIPSTNKISTELYECVLIDPKTGKHIYPQVKTGDAKIDVNNYLKLAEKGDVWLFSTNNKIEKKNEASRNIFVADKDELFNFVSTKPAKKVLSKGILKWYEMMNE